MAELETALMLRLEASLSKFEKQMAKAKKAGSDASQKIERQFANSNKKIVASAEKSAKAIGQEMDRMRSKYDPLFAASKRYEAELADLNQAQKVGAISAQQYDAALERLNQSYTASVAGAQKMVVASRRVTTGMRGMQGSVGNIAAQFNDIGVTAAAGMNPMLIALQQGTQLSQAFAGQGLKASLKGVASGFAAMISPVSLVAIGITAVAAVAIQAATSLFTMGDSADDLKKKIADLNSAVDDYKAAVDAANAPTAELAEKYGLARAKAQDLLKALAQLAKAEAMQKVAESGDAVVEALAGVKRHLDELDRTMASNQLSETYAELSPMAHQLQEEFGLTVKQGRKLVSLMNDFQTASTFDEQASAVQKLASFLANTADASGEYNENLVEALRAAANASLAAAKLERTVSQTADGATRLADTVGSISFSSAISGANALAGQIGGMIGQAQKLLSVIGQAKMGNMRAEDRQKLAEAERDMLKAGKGRVEIEGQLARLRKGQELDRAGVNLPTAIYGKLIDDAGKVAEKTAAANEEIAKLKKNASTSGSGSSKGGRSQAESSIFDSTDRQLESLKRQVEMVGKTKAEIVGLTTKYQLLDAAKAKGIPISDALIQRIDAEAAAMAGHADQLEKARDKTEALNNLQAEWEDSVVNAAMGGKDAMEQFLNTLKKAALQYAFFGKGPLADIFGGSGTGILSGLGKLIGFNANGTDNWRGGLSVVGERGPELVNLPRGSQVFSNSKSREMMSGGGTVVNIINNTGQPVKEKRTRGPDGREFVTTIVGEEMGRGAFDGPLKSRNGVGVRKVRR